MDKIISLIFALIAAIGVGHHAHGHHTHGHHHEHYCPFTATHCPPGPIVNPNP